MMTSSPCCTNTLTTLKMECLPPTLTTHSLGSRSEEHTSELQSQSNLVCRLLLEKKKKKKYMSWREETRQAQCTHERVSCSLECIWMCLMRNDVCCEYAYVSSVGDSVSERSSMR